MLSTLLLKFCLIFTALIRWIYLKITKKEVERHLKKFSNFGKDCTSASTSVTTVQSSLKSKLELELLKYLYDSRNTIGIFEDYQLLKELRIHQI